jgi:hypothetical protein
LVKPGLDTLQVWFCINGAMAMANRLTKFERESGSEVDPGTVRQEVEAEFREEEDDLMLEELEPLEAEVGLDEVYVDQETLEAVAADDADENFDVDDDGVEEDLEDEEIESDLPQELTESYGTGLQGQPSDRAGRRAHLTQSNQFNEANAVLTGGDVDASYEDANAVGEEGVGGTVATPDQDIVDELGAAVGLEMDDRSFLRTNDVLEERDDRRWELEPKSSEDYADRQD